MACPARAPRAQPRPAPPRKLLIRAGSGLGGAGDHADHFTSTLIFPEPPARPQPAPPVPYGRTRHPGWGARDGVGVGVSLEEMEGGGMYRDVFLRELGLSPLKGGVPDQDKEMLAAC